MARAITIGDRIRYLRELRQITQVKLAEKVCVSQGWLSQVESGDRMPDADVVEKIAQELGYPIRMFFPAFMNEEDDKIINNYKILCVAELGGHDIVVSARKREE